jgi:hypothetical protein
MYDPKNLLRIAVTTPSNMLSCDTCSSLTTASSYLFGIARGLERGGVTFQVRTGTLTLIYIHIIYWTVDMS